MSDVEKFNCMLMHGFPCMMPKENGLWVQSANFDDAQSELAALREELAVAKQLASGWKEQERLRGIQALNAGEALTAAEQRNAKRDIESAAKILANCMDYPWEHMPENGRTLMRKHAKCIVDAALAQPTESGASE